MAGRAWDLDAASDFGRCCLACSGCWLCWAGPRLPWVSSPLALGVLDVNRDGTSELLVIGEEIHLLEVVPLPGNPWKVEHPPRRRTTHGLPHA